MGKIVILSEAKDLALNPKAFFGAGARSFASLRTTRACYLPLNTGFRFSMKARRPSLKSSLSKQVSVIFASFA